VFPKKILLGASSEDIVKLYTLKIHTIEAGMEVYIVRIELLQ
jgi:hypothetical protein